MRWLPSFALTLWCTLASGATLSGTIKNGAGTGVAANEVRLWSRSGKWFAISQTIAAASDGRYSFTVVAGDYLVDTRAGVTYADRWYDTDGSGYVPADADVVTVVSGQDKMNVDITVEPSGGVDGIAKVGASLAAGLQVRAEQIGDPRIHHNEDSQAAPRQGEFHMRSMPPGMYRVLVHDPSAANGDEVTLAPFSIGTGMNASAGTLSLSPAATDPSEPNNSRGTATMFTAAAGADYTSPTNSRIAPRNAGDVDWYCTTAQPGERFIARAQSTVAVEGNMSHENPWVDPVIAAYRTDDAGTFVKFAEDDDSGPLVTDALVDTGELPGGQVCFVVSTYGDTAYNGTNQGSAGDYSLTVKYGNRGPTVTATSGGNPLPSMVTMNEGDLLQVALTWSDPEMDPIQATWNMVGASGAVATAGTFMTATGSGNFLWRAPQTAAKDSPYVLTFRVSDGELVRLITVNVVVLAVNVAPTVPVPLSPADGGHVASQTPSLVCRESTDEDQETLSYEYELYYGGDGGTVAQTGSVVGVDGGWQWDGGGPLVTVALGATAIPENSLVRWRARAFDGHAGNGYSMWSPLVSFVVDVMNDPPAAPVLDKPADGDTVLVRRPTLSAVPPIDPEGDAYSLYFEVAKDSMFTMSVGISPAVAVGPGATTMWTFDQDLDWGTDYFARAWAVDVRNGKSAYSNVNAFKVRANSPPTVPPFVSPDMQTCAGDYLSVKPERVQIGPSTDTEGDAIQIQLRVFAASENPDTATPLFDKTVMQTPTSTDFDVSILSLPMDVQHRFQARAVDAYGASMWSECLFTVGMRPPMNDGGQGGGSGGGGGGGGGTTTKGGCHCGSAEGLLALAALALLRRRKKQGQASRPYRSR